jgi:hypothetical protein
MNGTGESPCSRVTYSWGSLCAVGNKIALDLKGSKCYVVEEMYDLWGESGA